jgi:hypothetical protein
MTTAAEIAANKICEDGHRAGQTILNAIDHAYDARCILSARKFRRVFDAMVESLTDEMSPTDAPLFIASAYEALPAVFSSAIERAKIDQDAWSAYETYLREAASELAADEADYRYDQMRDERLLAGAK